MSPPGSRPLTSILDPLEQLSAKHGKAFPWYLTWSRSDGDSLHVLDDADELFNRDMAVVVFVQLPVCLLERTK